MKRLRLHHRLVIPFAVIALVATMASAFVALSVVSRDFEARIRSQMLNTSEVISRGGFAFTPGILRSVKAVTGADVITFDSAGSIVSTTVDPSRTDLFVAVLASPLAQEARGAVGLGFFSEMQCPAPCYVSYRSVVDRPGVVVAVVLEAAENAAAVRAVSRTIVVTALASLALLVLVSQLVARRMTRPLDDLVRFTNDVAVGTPPHDATSASWGPGTRRAREGDDDVGRLGRAFNQMLDRLDQSRSALIRSEKLGLAGLLAARVAHDIRNPLASMKINTQLLEKSVANRNAEVDLTNAVLHDIEQVESVIRDLIELARPSELRLVPVDLNAVIRTTMRQLDARLAHRKVVASLNLPDRLPLVMIDTERFSQALLNVIVNAVDAMPNGGALTVTTHAQPGEVVIDVEDEGTGIDPALSERVFDPFVSSKPEGVGLGLVNVKAVVEGHGGRISLTPRQPRGTRARIVLPAS